VPIAARDAEESWRLVWVRDGPIDRTWIARQITERLMTRPRLRWGLEPEVDLRALLGHCDVRKAPLTTRRTRSKLNEGCRSLGDGWAASRSRAKWRIPGSAETPMGIGDRTNRCTVAGTARTGATSSRFLPILAWLFWSLRALQGWS